MSETCKTVMFKNGNTLEITQENAESISIELCRVSTLKDEYYTDSNDGILINLSEIVYIS